MICTLEQFRVTGHKYPKKGARNRESNPYFPGNSSFQLDILPLLRSYENLKAIIDCTYFSVGILGIKAIKGSWTQIPQTIDIDNESNSNSSNSHFESIEILLNCKG